MKTKLKFIPLLLLALLFCSCATAPTRYAPRQIITLKPDTAPLAVHIAKAHKSVSAIKTDSDRVTSSIAHAQAAVEVLTQAAPPAEREALQSVKQDLTAAQEANASLQAQSVDLQGTIDALETDKATLASQIDQKEVEEQSFRDSYNSASNELAKQIDAGIKKDADIAAWRRWAWRWGAAFAGLALAAAGYLYFRLRL